jgi:hypothetical protein
MQAPGRRQGTLELTGRWQCECENGWCAATSARRAGTGTATGHGTPSPTHTLGRYVLPRPRQRPRVNRDDARETRVTGDT